MKPVRFATILCLACVAWTAQAQPLPVNDRAVTAIDLWTAALPRVEVRTEGGVRYFAWVDAGAPVSVVEQRADGVSVAYYYDRADLIRYRRDGDGTSLVIDFVAGKAAGTRKSGGGGPAEVGAAEIAKALAEGAAVRNLVLAQSGGGRAAVRREVSVMPPARPGPGSFGLLPPGGGITGQIDYRRPRPAEAEWLSRIADFLPAMNRCLDWYGGPPMHIGQAWPLGARVGVRLVGADGARVDCVADADGSRSALLAALSIDAPLAPGEGQVVYTPAGRQPPAGECFTTSPTPGGAPGTVTMRRC